MPVNVWSGEFSNLSGRGGSGGAGAERSDAAGSTAVDVIGQTGDFEGDSTPQPPGRRRASRMSYTSSEESARGILKRFHEPWTRSCGAQLERVGRKTACEDEMLRPGHSICERGRAGSSTRARVHTVLWDWGQRWEPKPLACIRTHGHGLLHNLLSSGAVRFTISAFCEPTISGPCAPSLENEEDVRMPRRVPGAGRIRPIRAHNSGLLRLRTRGELVTFVRAREEIAHLARERARRRQVRDESPSSADAARGRLGDAQPSRAPEGSRGAQKPSRAHVPLALAGRRVCGLSRLSTPALRSRDRHRRAPGAGTSRSCAATSRTSALTCARIHAADGPGRFNAVGGRARMSAKESENQPRSVDARENGSPLTHLCVATPHETARLRAIRTAEPSEYGRQWGFQSALRRDIARADSRLMHRCDASERKPRFLNRWHAPEERGPCGALLERVDQVYLELRQIENEKAREGNALDRDCTNEKTPFRKRPSANSTVHVVNTNWSSDDWLRVATLVSIREPRKSEIRTRFPANTRTSKSAILLFIWQATPNGFSIPAVRRNGARPLGLAWTDGRAIFEESHPFCYGAAGRGDIDNLGNTTPHEAQEKGSPAGALGSHGDALRDKSSKLRPKHEAPARRDALELEERFQREREREEAVPISSEDNKPTGARARAADDGWWDEGVKKVKQDSRCAVAFDYGTMKPKSRPEDSAVDRKALRGARPATLGVANLKSRRSHTSRVWSISPYPLEQPGRVPGEPCVPRLGFEESFAVGARRIFVRFDSGMSAWTAGGSNATPGRDRCARPDADEHRVKDEVDVRASIVEPVRALTWQAFIIGCHSLPIELVMHLERQLPWTAYGPILKRLRRGSVLALNVERNFAPAVLQQALLRAPAHDRHVDDTEAYTSSYDWNNWTDNDNELITPQYGQTPRLNKTSPKTATPTREQIQSPSHCLDLHPFVITHWLSKRQVRTSYVTAVDHRVSELDSHLGAPALTTAGLDAPTLPGTVFCAIRAALHARVVLAVRPRRGGCTVRHTLLFPRLSPRTDPEPDAERDPRAAHGGPRPLASLRARSVRRRHELRRVPDPRLQVLSEAQSLRIPLVHGLSAERIRWRNRHHRDKLGVLELYGAEGSSCSAIAYGLGLQSTTNDFSVRSDRGFAHRPDAIHRPGPNPVHNGASQPPANAGAAPRGVASRRRSGWKRVHIVTSELGVPYSGPSCIRYSRGTWEKRSSRVYGGSNHGELLKPPPKTSIAKLCPCCRIRFSQQISNIADATLGHVRHESLPRKPSPLSRRPAVLTVPNPASRNDVEVSGYGNWASFPGVRCRVNAPGSGRGGSVARGPRTTMHSAALQGPSNVSSPTGLGSRQFSSERATEKLRPIPLETVPRIHAELPDAASHCAEQRRPPHATATITADHNTETAGHSPAGVERATVFRFEGLRPEPEMTHTRQRPRSTAVGRSVGPLNLRDAPGAVRTYSSPRRAARPSKAQRAWALGPDEGNQRIRPASALERPKPRRESAPGPERVRGRGTRGCAATRRDEGTSSSADAARGGRPCLGNAQPSRAPNGFARRADRLPLYDRALPGVRRPRDPPARRRSRPVGAPALDPFFLFSSFFSACALAHSPSMPAMCTHVGAAVLRGDASALEANGGGDHQANGGANPQRSVAWAPRSSILASRRSVLGARAGARPRWEQEPVGPFEEEGERAVARPFPPREPERRVKARGGGREAGIADDPPRRPASHVDGGRLEMNVWNSSLSPPAAVSFPARPRGPSSGRGPSSFPLDATRWVRPEKEKTEQRREDIRAQEISLRERPPVEARRGGRGEGGPGLEADGRIWGCWAGPARLGGCAGVRARGSRSCAAGRSLGPRDEGEGEGERERAPPPPRRAPDGWADGWVDGWHRPEGGPPCGGRDPRTYASAVEKRGGPLAPTPPCAGGASQKRAEAHDLPRARGTAESKGLESEVERIAEAASRDAPGRATLLLSPGSPTPRPPSAQSTSPAPLALALTLCAVAEGRRSARRTERRGADEDYGYDGGVNRPPQACSSCTEKKEKEGEEEDARSRPRRVPRAPPRPWRATLDSCPLDGPIVARPAIPRAASPIAARGISKHRRTPKDSRLCGYACPSHRVRAAGSQAEAPQARKNKPEHGGERGCTHPDTHIEKRKEEEKNSPRRRNNGKTRRDTQTPAPRKRTVRLGFASARVPGARASRHLIGARARDKIAITPGGGGWDIVQLVEHRP
ncbi:uncharacterized protein BXZ73DRAFT_79523 [Epithele typhae]|uniref:uncharacterized protein n=1 Tax=Epithele typhae TaxID=378194 RepID=UPI00200828BB|nr:uncharacterized protein BXZ73DRAFT_79523 [Epithele typhae]KAH9923463.1 hypothetical protein BXZ73DRAFT_79523 [Epithele typhae]